MAHACNPRSQEVGAGGLLAWATQQVQGQPQLQREPVSRNQGLGIQLCGEFLAYHAQGPSFNP
jgi:hypothetical protein